jgi:hypothetical protein
MALSKITTESLASGAGGSWAFIATVTASSSATVDFLDTFSATYDIYKLVMTAVTPATDGAVPTIRYAIGDAARSTSGDYRWVTDGARDAGDTTGATQLMASNSATYIKLGNSGGTATGEQNFCEFTIFGVNDTDNHKASSWHLCGTGNGGQTRVYTGSAVLDAATTAISGIQFLYSTGAVASGEFYLYGLNKS